MEFKRLVESLAEKIGIEITDEGGAAAVEVDGLTVLLHEADDDLLLLHADLGEIPADGRDVLAVAALQANFLYQGTGGSTLAVDSRDGHLHLQKYNWLDRLDAEKAVADIARFADMVKTWKGLVAETAASAPATADGLSAPMSGGFMQV